jgi:hypothetical protein
MNQDEVSQLARQIVSEIVPLLKARLSLTFIEESGVPILVATAGSSVLHLNPQVWAEKLISDRVRDAAVLHKPSEGDVEAQTRFIIRNSKKDLILLLSTVHLLLGDALWVLEMLSHAATVDFEFGPFWQDVRIGVKWSTLLVIDGRLRKLLNLPEKSLTLSSAERKELVGPKHAYAITDTQMITALKQLEQFSINKLAKLLAPERDDFRKSVYDWMGRKGIDRSELESWWEKLRSDVEKFD